MAKRVYIGIDSLRGLPSGYTELTYIESTGTQYIDTGFKPNNNTRVLIDVQATSQAHGTFVFGTLDNWAVNMYGTVITNTGWEDEYGAYPASIAGSPLNRNVIDKNKNVTKLNGVTVATHTAQTFQSSDNLVLCCEYYIGEIISFSKIKIFSCKIYNNGTLIRDFVPCKNSSTVGLYDMVNKKFYANAGTGTFVAGSVVPTGGAARKVKKMYIGIGDKARKVKKGYIGDENGKARLFYHDSIRFDSTPLSEARTFTWGAKTSKHIVFAGSSTNADGTISKDLVGTVDAFTEDGTRSTPMGITPSNGPCGGSVGDYAVFFHGDARAGGYAYNSSLTRRNVTKHGDDLGYSRTLTFKDNLLLVGGAYYLNTSAAACRYNTALTKTSLTGLIATAGTASTACTDTHAIVAGGDYRSGTGTTQGYRTTATAYDANFTRVTAPDLTTASSGRLAASGGKYAIICSGSQMDVYDTNLTKTSITPVTERNGGVSGYFDKKYVFASGSGQNLAYYYKEDTLTRVNLGESMVKRYEVYGVQFGNKLFIGGGHHSGALLDNVEYLDFNLF